MAGKPKDHNQDNLGFNISKISKMILKSGLFDEEFYRNTYELQEDTGVSLLMHYIEIGIRKGFHPNRYFDPKWYLKQYPFIAVYQYPLLLHYHYIGWKKNMDPGPDFSTQGYLKTYPDVARAGIDPLSHFVLYGSKEGRMVNNNPEGITDSRRLKIFNCINVRNSLGLEIGPSYNPVLPKKEGFNIHVLDHCSREGLVEIYKPFGVDTDKIESVDYILSGGSISETLGKNRYDYIIASHVLEHIPDPITWLQDLSIVLKDGGYFFLTIPDKRYCFDKTRPLSTIGQWLDAAIEKRCKHTIGSVFDHINSAVTNLGKYDSWSRNAPLQLDFKFSLEQAKERMDAALSTKDYVDCHAWVMTPESLKKILLELNYMGIIQFVIESEFPTVGCEFYFNLRKSHFPVSKEEYYIFRMSLLQNSSDKNT